MAKKAAAKKKTRNQPTKPPPAVKASPPKHVVAKEGRVAWRIRFWKTIGEHHLYYPCRDDGEWHGGEADPIVSDHTPTSVLRIKTAVFGDAPPPKVLSLSLEVPAAK